MSLRTDHPLHREHELAAVVRFAKGQVGIRLAVGAVVHDWVKGSKVLRMSGMNVILAPALG